MISTLVFSLQSYRKPFDIDNFEDSKIECLLNFAINFLSFFPYHLRCSNNYIGSLTADMRSTDSKVGFGSLNYCVLGRSCLLGVVSHSEHEPCDRYLHVIHLLA